MKLKDTIIQQLKSSRALRMDVAIALDFSELWIDKVVEANKENGPLTLAKSLQVLRDELKLDNSQILEESEVKA